MPRDWNSALGIFLKALRDNANVDDLCHHIARRYSQLLPGIAGLNVSATLIIALPISVFVRM